MRRRLALLVLLVAVVCAGLVAVAVAGDPPYAPSGNSQPIDDNHPGHNGGHDLP